jgi:hypothetical protein
VMMSRQCSTTNRSCSSSKTCSTWAAGYIDTAHKHTRTNRFTRFRQRLQSVKAPGCGSVVLQCTSCWQLSQG